MFDNNFLYISTIIISFALLGYYFWKDATQEGYSPIKTLDVFFVIVFMALLGGKVFLREINYEFLRYEFIRSPLSLEGILLGGSIGLFLMVKRYRWDIWKIGDTIASALAIFKAFLFLSFYIANRSISNLIVAICFAILFSMLRFLKKEHSMGSSKDYFMLKRYKRTFFSGVLLTIYLTWTSVVAILFLLLNRNLGENFWRLQLSFYLFVALFALYIFIKKTKNDKSD